MSVSVARRSKRREENCLERYSGELRNRNEEYLVNICESNIVWAQVIFPVLLVAKFTFLHRDGARMHQEFQQTIHIKKKKMCTRISTIYEYVYTYRRKKISNILERKLCSCFGQLLLFY